MIFVFCLKLELFFSQNSVLTFHFGLLITLKWALQHSFCSLLRCQVLNKAFNYIHWIRYISMDSNCIKQIFFYERSLLFMFTCCTSRQNFMYVTWTLSSVLTKKKNKNRKTYHDWIIRWKLSQQTANATESINYLKKEHFMIACCMQSLFPMWRRAILFFINRCFCCFFLFLFHLSWLVVSFIIIKPIELRRSQLWWKEWILCDN